jgi:hypothetical protein
MLQEPQVINETLAKDFEKNYRCAGCWGRLKIFYDWQNKTWLVSCAKNCGSNGFVTNYFVERQLNNSVQEKILFNKFLADIIIPDHKKKTNDQLLKELGY